MTTHRPSHDEVVANTAETAHAMPPQRVPVNAYETPGALVIVAPFAAVTAADVGVELTADRVRFWGELRSSGPRQYVLHEWEYGGYEREVGLPPGYGADVEASLTNGQLVVRVLAGPFGGVKRIAPTAG